MRGLKDCTIRMGGDCHPLGQVLPSVAMRKAHTMLRESMRQSYYSGGRSRREYEARVIADGEDIGGVTGFYRNNTIQIVHL